MAHIRYFGGRYGARTSLEGYLLRTFGGSRVVLLVCAPVLGFNSRGLLNRLVDKRPMGGQNAPSFSRGIEAVSPTVYLSALSTCTATQAEISELQRISMEEHYS